MFITNQNSPHDAYDTLDVWNARSEGSSYRSLCFRQGNPSMCCLQGLHTNKPTHQSLKGQLVKGVYMFCRQWSIKMTDFTLINWIRLYQSVSILTSQSLAPSPHMPTLYLTMIRMIALKISVDTQKQINTSQVKNYKSCDVRLTNNCGAQKLHKNEFRKLWGCLFLKPFSIIE